MLCFKVFAPNNYRLLKQLVDTEHYKTINVNITYLFILFTAL